MSASSGASSGRGSGFVAMVFLGSGDFRPATGLAVVGLDAGAKAGFPSGTAFQRGEQFRAQPVAAMGYERMQCEQRQHDWTPSDR